MTSQPRSPINIVFGCMTFGEKNAGARVTDITECGKIIDVFQAHGHKELDVARGYARGTSEKYLSQLDLQKRGIVLDTKLYPNVTYDLPPEEKYTHKAADVRRGLMDSLKALNVEKVDMFYLHGPDRQTPFEETLSEVNKLHQEGYFNRFGISNYWSWEVARICEICNANGWIRPSAYEGVYHALQRSIEAELMPCLRHYGISLYAFQPLAGGFLTGRYTRDQQDFEPGSRFDPQLKHAATGSNLHRGRYWNDAYFDALDLIKGAADKHGLTVGEVALRWATHHSVLKKELGDSLILGASRVEHIESNLVDVEKGSLPEDVVEALERAWLLCKALAPKYWH